jgi:iron complex outermembrane receptor protein
MGMLRFSVSVRLALIAALAGSLVSALALPGWAQEEREQSLVIGQSSLEDSQDLITNDQEQATNDQEQITNDSILQLSQIDQPATTVTDWIAQIQASLVQVTGVQVEETETGLQVILETENGVLEVPETRSIGNALIADIPNASIAEEFSQAEPIEGIALVTVTSLPDDRVRVAITGTDAPPVAEVISEAQGLVLAVTLGDADAVAEADAIQVVVTGEQDEGYNLSSASTATRTDTPLRDIPASIQVIPQEIIEDQGVARLQDAVRNNSPGVTTRFGQNQNFVIRGFNQRANLRNGLRTSSLTAPLEQDLADVERIEVLRGPASVLFGQLEPGGVVNVVTEQPLREPYYNLQFTGGQFSFYRPELDFSGPLTEDGDLRYWLNAAYQNYGSFRDFVNKERFFVAPVLQWDISENTTLTIDFSYTYTDTILDGGVLALSDGSLALPINRAVFYPSLGDVTEEQIQTSYRLEHRFSDNWQLRNSFSFYSRTEPTTSTYAASLVNDRVAEMFYYEADFLFETYQFQTDVIGEFTTEKILFLKPDLILGLKDWLESSYKQLSDIAPTILLNRDIWGRNWNFSFKTSFRDIAKLFDREEFAEEILTQYQSHITEVKNQLGNRLKNAEVSAIIYGCGGNNGFSVPPRYAIWFQILDDLSIKIKPVFPTSKNFYMCSVSDSIETINNYDSDILFIFNTHGNSGDFLLEKPLISSLNAVRNGRAYVINGQDVWDVYGPSGANRLLDVLSEKLLKAAQTF